MKLIIESIPHDNQRYETCGDYYNNSFGEHILISEMPENSVRLVAIHELIEKWLTESKGISEEEITKFDLMFEQERKEGKHGEFDEPGDDIRAPYRKQHKIATFIEKMICKEFGMKWSEHENNCNRLFIPKQINPEIGK